MNDQSVYVHSGLRLGVWPLIFAMTLTLLACSLTEIATPPASPTATAAVSLSNNANTFDSNTFVGQHSPTFTLMDAKGQPYTFTPNDGRKHVIVFYMGYVQQVQNSHTNARCK